jgi:FKBP-type peptidyl-prolyl cis-trans isomerase
MTLPARPRGTITLTLAAAAAASLAGALTATAQQPSSTAAAPASGITAPAPAEKKTPAKGTAAESEASEKNAQSYSLGLIWGEELRSHGVKPEAISTARIAQGVRDAITGKVAVSDKDHANLRALAASASEASQKAAARLGEANHKAAATFLAENGKKPGVTTTKSGLQYQELRAGSGGSPKASDSVVVNYRGTLLDGTEFDSSYKRGEPLTFEVDRVIPGWTEALQLMKPGARWKLFIPPQLAYDLRSPPSIPPGSMLIFDVELISVKPAAPGAPAPAPK